MTWKSRQVGVWVLVFVNLVGCNRSSDPSKAPAAANPLKDLSAEQLIDKLQETSNEDYGVRTNIIQMGEDGKGKMPEGLLKSRDPGPKPSEAMHELVRRGAAVVPALCAHIDDQRKSKAKVQGMMGLGYSAFYDRNKNDGLTAPPGLNKNEWDMGDDTKVEISKNPDIDGYRLAVGDHCFELLGQIVGRNFQAVTYRPSAIVTVNSPVLCPALASAVRNEWGNLNEAEHKKRLIRDVTMPDASLRAENAVTALWRYYPDAVPAAVRQRLNLPVFDKKLMDLAFSQAVCIQDAAERALVLRKFAQDNGPEYRDFLYQRLRLAYEDVNRIPRSKAELREAMAQLAEVAGPPQQTYPDPIGGLELEWNSEFVAALKGIASAEVDEVVLAEFRKHCRQDGPERTNRDLVAMACVEHLAHRGQDAEFLDYCRKRRSQFADRYAKADCERMIQELVKSKPASNRP